MQRLLSVPFLLILIQVAALPVQAGPVLCSSSLEVGEPGTAPVEVTVCEPVQSTSELVTQRFFTWTAPYARGIDLMHQTLTCSVSLLVERMATDGWAWDSQIRRSSGTAVRFTTPRLLCWSSRVLRFPGGPWICRMDSMLVYPGASQGQLHCGNTQAGPRGSSNLVNAANS